MEEFIYNFLNWSAFVTSIPFLVSGLWMTFKLAAVSLVFSLIIGVVGATLRFVNRKLISWTLVAYVDILRATPPIVLIIFIYYTLPFVGIQFPAFVAAIISLSLYTGAYNAEIIRGAINSVPSGQVDAARSLGLSFRQAVQHVILPQAIRVAIPPLMSQVVVLIQLTSVAYIVALPELLNMSRWAQSLTANSTPLLAAAVVYLAILMPLSRLSRWVELRLRWEAGRVRQMSPERMSPHAP